MATTIAQADCVVLEGRGVGRSVGPLTMELCPTSRRASLITISFAIRIAIEITIASATGD